MAFCSSDLHRLEPQTRFRGMAKRNAVGRNMAYWQKKNRRAVHKLAPPSQSGRRAEARCSSLLLLHDHEARVCVPQGQQLPTGGCPSACARFPLLRPLSSTSSLTPSTSSWFTGARTAPTCRDLIPQPRGLLRSCYRLRGLATSPLRRTLP